MPPPQDSLIYLRQLRTALRRLREGSGLTQRQVAGALDWSPSKVIRIESGTVGLSTTDLRALLQHYGVVDAEKVDRFVTMLRESKRQTGWWEAFKDVASPQYLTYIRYEHSASSIQIFQPLFIPGLLQNDDYARAVIQQGRGADASEQVNRRVALRMRRQEELFERADPPQLLFVLDEAVLHRQVGGPDVMRRQLHRIKQDAAREHVSVLVLPFTTGAHPGLSGPFVILEFSDYADDVLYLETAKGSLNIREEKEEVDEFRKALGEIQVAAEDADTESLIDGAMQRMLS